MDHQIGWFNTGALDLQSLGEHPIALDGGRVLTLWLGLTAAAGPPVLTTSGDALTGVVEIDASPQVIKGVLADPTSLPRISGDGTEVTILSQDGACQVLQSVSPSAFITVRYKTRRCPTSTGFQSTLIESNAFSSYDTSWVVEPSGSGSRVTYRIELVSTLWVPRGVVRRGVRNGIESFLSNMQGWAWTDAP